MNRISKQKQREALLKTIEQTKLTTRNNDIRHNRFVTQTTGKVNELSERVRLINKKEDELRVIFNRNQFWIEMLEKIKYK